MTSRTRFDSKLFVRIPKTYTPWKVPPHIFTKKFPRIFLVKTDQFSTNRKIIILLAVDKLLPPPRHFAETHKKMKTATKISRQNTVVHAPAHQLLRKSRPRSSPRLRILWSLLTRPEGNKRGRNGDLQWRSFLFHQSAVQERPFSPPVT